MRLSSSLVNRCLTYIRADRRLQLKTFRLLIILNIIMFSPIIILFYFNFNSINGLQTNQNESAVNDISFQIGLDVQNLYRLFWTIDYQSESLTFEVRSVLNNSYDWFAIGFSDYGEIFGADLCILWFDRKHKLHFQDIHTDENSFVFVDEDSNDCKLLSVKKKAKVIRYAFRRNFDTCDPQDYVIEDGTTHIIYATGKGPLLRVDGIRLNDFKHGFQRTQLLRKLEVLPKLASNTKMIELLNDKVSVPNIETTYWCRLHLLPQELVDKHHIIQYEAVIQKGNELLVHHMELFHCEVSSDQELPDWNGSCFATEKPNILETCKRVISAWAMGAGPLSYPKEAGLPVGGKNYSLYVMLEIHYNNPEMRSDWIDSSGIRLYYTDKLRAHDSGVLEIGLEYSDKNSIPPKQNIFDLSGFCVAECTRAALPDYGITIWASQLHTHLTGIGVWTQHIRGSVELPEVNRDNHYSPHFQEIRKLKQKVNVFPGDVLINTCQYRTTNRTNITLGGHAITDEMCVNYLHYYPKTNLEVCKSSVDSQYLSAYFQYMNERESQMTSNNKSVSQNFKSIDWNPNRKQFLNRLYKSAPLSMQCNQSSGERFPGYWNGVPVPQIRYPLKETKKKCTKT